MSGTTRARARRATATATAIRRPSRFEFSTVRARFESDGRECVGTLYRPDRPADPPVVVMAPGFGAARRWGLPAYAERFAERGYAVYLFDFAHFGDSEGEPRGLVSPTRQLTDWRAAVGAVRGLDGVDARRLALWGTSLAGGHALRLAAEDLRVSAVVAQTPVLDGRGLLRTGGISGLVRALGAGVRDRLQSFVTDPHVVPTAGDPGEFAALPGAYAGMRGIVDDPGRWENRIPARSFLGLARYRPVSTLEDVACPTLLLGGTRDDIAPVDTVADAAESVPTATFVRMPTDHFGPFDGPTFEESLGHQLAFLDAHL